MKTYRVRGTRGALVIARHTQGRNAADAVERTLRFWEETGAGEMEEAHAEEVSS